MTGYGSSLYGSDWYAASPYVARAERTFGLRVRIVKPVTSVPPVMDTIARGLAQRFDWLQQGIQSFSLFNKIEYATGEANGIVASLDDVGGKIYDLPRLAGESDDDYRSRLQTYLKVLIGSGTIPACQEVLDFLIGLNGATSITSQWPARAMIDFTSIDAMRLARQRKALLESVLPGMFAAGIDYELIIPYMDVLLTASIRGDATLDLLLRAAVATENELSYGIDALVTYGRSLDLTLKAGIATEISLITKLRATIRAERVLYSALLAAVCGSPSLSFGLQSAIQAVREASWGCDAAIQAEPELPCDYLAAVARTFDLRFGLLARITNMFDLPINFVAAVRAEQELSFGIRVRIARRFDT